MPHGISAAALQHVEKSRHVAVDIGARILQRIAHSRLRREVDHHVETPLRKEAIHALGILQTHSQKVERRIFRASTGRSLRRIAPDAQISESGALQAHVVIVVDRIDSRDLASCLQKVEAQMMADKSGRLP